MKEQVALGTPERLQDEIQAMCEQTVQMLRLTWEGFRRQDPRSLQPAEKLGRQIHQREKVLTEWVVKSAAAEVGPLGKEPELAFVPMHLERIGDNIELLVGAIHAMVQEGIPFSDRAMREVNALFEKAIDLTECIKDAIATKNRVLVQHILQEGEQFERMANEYATAHEQRLIEGLCLSRASSVFLAVLDYLRGIAWHVRQIAQKLSTIPST